MNNYIPRVLDEKIKFKLQTIGCLVIVGPKMSGKSTTGLMFSNSSIFMQDSQTYDFNYILAKNDPKNFLNKKPPLLIDEWQEIPFIWDSIRHEIDFRNKNGQFIITGSHTPIDRSVIRHSGTGRFVEIFLSTMTLFETRDSNGEISLNELFDNKKIKFDQNKTDIFDIAYYICRGGWPAAAIQLNKKIALEVSKNFYEGIINYDILYVDNVKRDSSRLNHLLRSISRNVSTTAKFQLLKRDMEEIENVTINIDTVSDYVKALKKLYLIEEIPCWNTKLRSKTSISSSPVRYLVDSSIATAALKISPNDLLKDFETLGLLFENLCIHDLKVYIESLGGEIFHYRDSSGDEIDAVVKLPDGRWGAIEIKLGKNIETIDRAAEKLKKIVNKFDLDHINKPSFLMILTGISETYIREDGIYVIPITKLKN